VGAAVVVAIVWMMCQALVPAVVGKAIDAGIIHRDTRRHTGHRHEPTGTHERARRR
jgi:hypothetical protein